MDLEDALEYIGDDELVEVTPKNVRIRKLYLTELAAKKAERESKGWYNSLMEYEAIVFGGGCFWCTEAVFKMLKGVASVEPGYAGGMVKNPTYEQVCAGTTGHAEVIKVEYNPQAVNLETLLTVFFATHDPTIKDRQGNDVGSQYRSIILYQTQDQKLLCDSFIASLNASSEYGAPIITEVKKLEVFYTAEDYHRNYYENNKNQGYCQVVINPKLKKVQEKFSELLNKWTKNK